MVLRFTANYPTQANCGLEWGTHGYWFVGAVTGGGAGGGVGAGGADFAGWALPLGAFEFEVEVEFGAGGDGLELVRQAVEREFDLERELDGVKQRRGGSVVDASVEEGVLDLHDGEHDGFGAFEDGEFDAGVLVHADGAAEAYPSLLAPLPLVVEVAHGVMTESGGSAEDAVGLDVGTGTDGSHEGLHW